jgi:hypothetical protein
MAIIGNIPYFQTNPFGDVWRCVVHLSLKISAGPALTCGWSDTKAVSNPLRVQWYPVSHTQLHCTIPSQVWDGIRKNVLQSTNNLYQFIA